MLYPAELLALSSQTPYNTYAYANNISCGNSSESLKTVSFVAFFIECATKSATKLKVVLPGRLYILISQINNFKYLY
jgi:hypothetical protein